MIIYLFEAIHLFLEVLHLMRLHGAGLWCSTPTDRDHLIGIFRSLLAELLFCIHRRWL